jgi:hypothetical protein
MIRTLLVIAALALGCTSATYDYDPTTAGDPEVDTPPRQKSPSQFVRGIYADLLGRSPETYEQVITLDGQELFRVTLDEERQLVGTLDGLGDSLPMRNLIANGVLHSAELSLPDKASVEPTAYIRDQFRALLGREPNPYELAAFVDEWERDPAVGPRTILRAILGSREYQSQ